MALVGGGGSPNVAGGANPAGVGSGLNYVGEFCYATLDLQLVARRLLPKYM